MQFPTDASGYFYVCGLLAILTVTHTPSGATAAAVPSYDSHPDAIIDHARLRRSLKEMYELMAGLPDTPAGENTIAPPPRPKKFRNAEELYTYLEELREYYSLISRPRFGRSVDNMSTYSAEKSRTLKKPNRLSSLQNMYNDLRALD